MILAVDDVMKLPEFAMQNEKVIEEKLNAAELMIRAYTTIFRIGLFGSPLTVWVTDCLERQIF